MADLISINRFKLDEEWAEQPRSHHKLCLDAADAKLKMGEAKADKELAEAEAKDELARVGAKLDHAIRSNPGLYGIDDRVTEKVVESALLRDKQYQDARAVYLRRCRKAEQAYLDSVHAYDVMKATVSASEHKRDALEDEVRLFLSGYFANPRARGDVKSDMDERKRKKLYEKIQSRNPDA